MMATPIVALNRAVAVAELSGPAEALRLVDELGGADVSGADVGGADVSGADVSGAAPSAGHGSGTSAGLAEYHLYHATRAELLRRLGRAPEAAAAYEAAITLAGNDTERSFLSSRLQSLQVDR